MAESKHAESKHAEPKASHAEHKTEHKTESKTKHAEATHHDEPKKGEVASELHEVTSALKGDLTKLAGPTATKVITHWQEKLDGLGVKNIATDLGHLKDLVGDKSPDGAKIGKNLAGLGDKVAKLAEEQGGVVGTALKSLAGALHKGSESLTHAKA